MGEVHRAEGRISILDTDVGVNRKQVFNFAPRKWRLDGSPSHPKRLQR